MVLTAPHCTARISRYTAGSRPTWHRIPCHEAEAFGYRLSYARSVLSTGGWMSQSFEVSQLTSSPTRHPKTTSATLWSPCWRPP